jgi:hypothetical protein
MAYTSAEEHKLILRMATTHKPFGQPSTPSQLAPKAKEVIWTKVPGKPHLEQSNEDPPKLRTRGTMSWA